MSYTLGDAAKAAGTSKTSIRRALDSGRISGTKDELGQWQIEPVELHRVYPRRAEPARSVAPDGTAELIAELREDRDRWRAQAERLTLLLTDQRPGWWARLWRRPAPFS